MSDQLNNIKYLDLVRYAFDFGYTEIIKSKSSTNWLSLKNPTTFDKIRINQKGINGVMYYQNNNPSYDQDKGNIINFTINRLNGQINPTTSPDKSQFSEAFKTLKAYMGVLEPVTEKVNFKVDTKVKDTIKIKSKIKQLTEKTNYTYNYLRDKRCLEKSTLDSPLFSQMIKESPVKMANGKVIFNTAFLKTDNTNKTIGFTAHFYSSKNDSNAKRVTELNDKAIFKSCNTTEAKNIFYGESAIDCLSHYQLFNAFEKPAYASIEGQISNGKIEALYDLYNDNVNPNKVLTSITDNDYTGYLFDIKTAIGFFNIKNPDKPIEEIQFENYTKFKFNNYVSSDRINIPDFKKHLENKLNEEATFHKRTNLKSYLNVVELKDTLIIEVPVCKDKKVFKYLSSLASFIHHSNNIKYKSHKPNPGLNTKNIYIKDWNDQLKKETLKKKKCLKT